MPGCPTPANRRPHPVPAVGPRNPPIPSFPCLNPRCWYSFLSIPFFVYFLLFNVISTSAFFCLIWMSCFKFQCRSEARQGETTLSVQHPRPFLQRTKVLNSTNLAVLWCRAWNLQLHYLCQITIELQFIGALLFNWISTWSHRRRRLRSELPLVAELLRKFKILLITGNFVEFMLSPCPSLSLLLIFFVAFVSPNGRF